MCMGVVCSRSSPFLYVQFQDEERCSQQLCFSDPLEVITAGCVAEVRPALRAIERGVGAGLYAVGYVAYEAAPAFDSALCVRDDAVLPLLWFGLFRGPDAVGFTHDDGVFEVSGWEPLISRCGYERALGVVRAAIGRGDTYQVNYTLRLQARFAGDDFAFYRRLCRAQRAAYCAYFNLGRYRVLSVSPELFFHRAGDSIVTRPMKGTVLRGRWGAEDRAQAAWLAGSEKNRAENLMIVDLLRNDLGRIAQVGSVSVSELFRVEAYRTVFQMTSTVGAQVRAGVSLEDVFGALFPCGSVTGAPKVSTMRLIAALEEQPRGVYCGAIGMVAPSGAATFSVAIRTMVLDSVTGVAEYGVGGGITWDSTVAEEYAEALGKAAVLMEEWPGFALLETMRLAQGRFVLLGRHLDRIQASAAYFDIPLDRVAIGALLQREALTHAVGCWRVRLLVAVDGEVRLEFVPLQDFSGAVLKVALARRPIARDDRFLFHKTTRRAVYDERRAECPDVYDVLLWNEQGEVTEFTTGNVVVSLQGQRWTPPCASGLLAGTLRAELLEQGLIRERVIRCEDLALASDVWLISSVRGWVAVQLVAVGFGGG